MNRDVGESKEDKVILSIMPYKAITLILIMRYLSLSELLSEAESVEVW